MATRPRCAASTRSDWSARFPPEKIKPIKEAFRLIYRSKYNTRQAIDAIRAELPSSTEINQIIEFIEQTERGIILLILLLLLLSLILILILVTHLALS